nr:hypothetical protein BaRGS_009244 [Batillaria attramentaria]
MCFEEIKRLQKLQRDQAWERVDGHLVNCELRSCILFDLQEWLSSQQGSLFQVMGGIHGGLETWGNFYDGDEDDEKTLIAERTKWGWGKKKVQELLSLGEKLAESKESKETLNHGVTLFKNLMQLADEQFQTLNTTSADLQDLRKVSGFTLGQGQARKIYLSPEVA